MINECATKIGLTISKYIELDKTKETELIYFLKRIIKNLIFYTITIILATVLDIIVSVLMILFSYYCLRLRFGGIHLENQTLCLIVSIILPLVLGYIASVYYLNLWLIIMLYIIMILHVNHVGVIDNINRPLTVEKKQKFKKQGLIILTIFFIVNIIVYLNNHTLVSNSIILGVILEGILLIRIPLKQKE